MSLTGIWESEGIQTDVIIFRNKFKVFRGRSGEAAKTVSDERCYGVLSYEITRLITDGDRIAAESKSNVVGLDGVINQVIAPVLSLRWARIAAEMLKTGAVAADYMSYEKTEDEMRARGYTGRTLCPFYMPDTIGFHILTGFAGYAIAQVEQFAAVQGKIESCLTARGYAWLADKTTWRAPDGSIWDEKAQDWSAADHLRSVPGQSGGGWSETHHKS